MNLVFALQIDLFIFFKVFAFPGQKSLLTSNYCLESNIICKNGTRIVRWSINRRAPNRKDEGIRAPLSAF